MIPVVEQLDLASLPRGEVTFLKLSLVADPRGERIHIPLMIAVGAHDGPALGVTAAMHGDELNGLRVIHRLFDELNLQDLHGMVIAAPVCNTPGFLNGTREFNDGADLNRIMPGKATGTPAELYAHRLMTRLICHFDYHIDLHTASKGRINTLYVRADLQDEITAAMAHDQHPQILLHNTGQDGTLRAAAADLNIPSITVEVGDPMRFQSKLIRYGFVGVANVMAGLKMEDLEATLPDFEPLVCERSYWIRTDAGGLLEVFPQLLTILEEGELIARVTDVFGRTLKEYYAPERGVVIGRSTSPMNQTGSRILHLGVLAPEGHALLSSDRKELIDLDLSARPRRAAHP